MTETRTDGECSKCGTLVTLIEHSDRRTCRADGSRYIYQLLPDDGYCIFRCEGCGEVIEDNFDPSDWQPYPEPRPQLRVVKS